MKRNMIPLNSSRTVRAREKTTMLRGFVAWLQGHVVIAGVASVVQGVLGVLAFGGLLSGLLGSIAIKAAALVAVILAVLGLFILLMANQVEWRQHVDQDRRLLLRYCDRLDKRYRQSWQVKSWDETVVVAANGDARVQINFSVVVDCDLLDFVSFVDGPNWERPEKYRRKTRIRVRSIAVDDRGGTRFEVTHSWISRERIKVLVHLGEAARRGTEISMIADLEWPARCFPLVARQAAEEFVLRFAHVVPLVRYTVVLPIGGRAYYDAVGLVRDADVFSLTSKENTEGSVEVVLTACDVAADRRIGLRLDLK